MRKNLERDEPDSRWTNSEIIAWIKVNGVLNEACGDHDSEEQIQEPPRPFKGPE